MALIYVTGISGAGKSTIAEELKKRGYEAYDADSEGFNAFYDRETGEKIETSKNDNPHSPEWGKKYIWKTSRKKVEELVAKAKKETIFLCGSSSNEKEIWDLLTKVICLVLDEKTLRHRIATRTSNDFGKADHELVDILEWNKASEENYRKVGASIVDTTQPLNVIVDEILKISVSNKPQPIQSGKIDSV